MEVREGRENRRVQVVREAWQEISARATENNGMPRQPSEQIVLSPVMWLCAGGGAA